LKELPGSLDGTYERTLQDIDKANWKFAHRIFQCVAVASRPLHVGELAEFLAFDFDAEPTPTYRTDWRPDDPLGALLSTCSSLIAVVETGNSEVIQFSHFSVKEFLMSVRLASAGDTISRYYVSTTPAHTLVAQACLGILLHLEENVTSDSLKTFPLAEYAAGLWVSHARLANMSADLQDGMKHLFDPRKRHFAVWVWIFDSAVIWHRSERSIRPSQPQGSCLHYAAFLGLHNLITFLVVECRQDVNAHGFGLKQNPLHMALRGRHVEFVRVLVDHGADVHARDGHKSTPLHIAAQTGHVGCAQILIEHGADVNAQEVRKWTPLHFALGGGQVEFAQLLVWHGADVNAQNISKSTPLHVALKGGHVEFAQILVGHGADVNSQDNYNSTPLHLALQGGHVEFARVLVGHGASVNSQDNYESTPLHLASMSGHAEFAQVLIEHGADVNVLDRLGLTPFELASIRDFRDIMQLLLAHGAVNMRLI
jgi:ankyrin repeat protein